MKIGARNILKGGAKRVKPGVVNDEVIISLEGGAEIVAVITRESAEAGAQRGQGSLRHHQGIQCDDWYRLAINRRLWSIIVKEM